MSKEAYYFSHDANARQDPKILAMMSVYGPEGYGWYWILIEMLREQSDFTLDKQGKYAFNAIAMQMHCNKDTSEQFVNDCINEFGLFETDGVKFWSNSLLRRMAMKEEISIKRKKAAEIRWSKQEDNANDMQMHNKSNANGMQGKEKKVNENKEKKNIYAEFVSMTEKEFNSLVEKYGKDPTNKMIEVLDNYKGSKGKTYKSDYRAILNWVVEKVVTEKPSNVVTFDAETKRKHELQKRLQIVAEQMEMCYQDDSKYTPLETEFYQIKEELKKFG